MIFQAAVYLRLSRDDGEAPGRSESNSITSQRDLICAFLKGQPDVEIYDIYTDDGFSGSSFDRPDFQRMMRDIEAGKVNLVVVKDLSRFGRDYIETGRYLQRIFPALSVRFIAITDHYDSFYADEGESRIVLPVKNFINDSYCRDISAKVKSQLEIKRKNGECIAPFAPYGYQKSQKEKNRLAKDPFAAAVVRQIFDWKIEGMAVAAIAKRLNEAGVLSPKAYKDACRSSYKGGFGGGRQPKWGSSAVKRILTDEVYLGDLVQGKTARINYKLKKSIARPKEEWVRTEHTHEAIVSRGCFRIAENLLRADLRVSPVTGEGSYFAGLLFCGDCGEQMVRRKIQYRGKQEVTYICSTKNRAEGCSRHSIGEEELKRLTAELISCYGEEFLGHSCSDDPWFEPQGSGEKTGWIPERFLLCCMIKRIAVFEDKRLEVEFFFTNQWRQKGEQENGQSI